MKERQRINVSYGIANDILYILCNLLDLCVAVMALYWRSRLSKIAHVLVFSRLFGGVCVMRYPSLSNRRHRLSEAAVRFEGIELLDVVAVAGLFCAGFLALNLHLLPETMPNPLWVPILVTSAYFGVPVGLLAVIAATGLTMLSGPAATPGAGDFYDAWLFTWADPALWVISAIWIGSFRQNQLREAAILRNDCAVLAEKVSVIQSYADQLSRRSRELERQIVTSALPATGDRRQLTPKQNPGNIVPLFGVIDAADVPSGARSVRKLAARSIDHLPGHLATATIEAEWSCNADVVVSLIVSELSPARTAESPNRSGEDVLPGTAGQGAREPDRLARVERN